MDMHGGGGGAMPMSAEAAIGAGGMGNNCDDLYEMLGMVPPHPTSYERMTGTTIMAVSFKGGVVVAADSRTSTGSYIANRTSDKLTPVAEKIYTCRSGSAADTQALSDYVRNYLAHYKAESGKEPTVKVAAHLFHSMSYANKDRLTAGIIVGGYDDVEGGVVYSVPVYSGALIKMPIMISGSGSTYIVGYCDANYREGMSREECESFCKNAVSLAMSRDGSSGGIIRMVTIDKDSVDRVYVPHQELPRHYEG